MPHDHSSADEAVWVLEGRLDHRIYSPKGAIEGLLVDVDGTSVQFVVPKGGHDPALATLKEGCSVVCEGRVASPSHKGEAGHEVYDLERLVSVDGVATDGGPEPVGGAHGKVVRFNYARHGEANGVVLDSGDFVHTRPEGFALLGFEIGMHVEADGEVRALVDGAGRVIEARVVNGVPL